LEGCGTDLLPAHLNQGADKIAHHVVQEGVGNNIEMEYVVLPAKASLEDVANGVLTLGRPAKAGKVVHADEVVSCCLHGVEVETRAKFPDVASSQGSMARPAADLVTVPALAGAESRMEAGGS